MFLNFFKSSAWSLGNVVACWQAFVVSQKKLVTIDGRVVLQGDHTYVPKDGQRMPGVVTLHQDSETQSKPSYFRGHCRGAVVGLAGSLLAPFGVPLNLGIHQGFVHIGGGSKEDATLGPKTEEVFALAINLLWRPTGDLVRFVLANTSCGPIVPMCNDLQIESVTALRLYCARTRIEIAFDMLKNLIGAFRYRFWSKGLPRHCRKPKKNAKLKGPSKKNVEKVKKCWTAIERFTMIGAISLGLLQLVSIKFRKTVWNHFESYLRTRSRELPSERTVKHVLSGCLCHIILRVASSGIMREIQSVISDKNIH